MTQAACRIRCEANGEYEAIDALHRATFGGETEAALVRDIRSSSTFDPALSIVAEVDAQIRGHILFSPIQFADDIDKVARDRSSEGSSDQSRTFADCSALALAPMAVHPQWQRRGIGSALVRAGLDACRRAGHRIVVVLGHPAYYPRFGFEQASRYGIRVPFDIPDEALMVAALVPGALTSVSGVVQYPTYFGTG